MLKKDTKIALGKTLFRIQAVVAFGKIEKGDKGGWIEAEENLAQSGDAWVSGRFQLLNLIGFKFKITITLQYARVGCMTLTHEEAKKITYRNKEVVAELSSEEFSCIKKAVNNGIEYLAMMNKK